MRIGFIWHCIYPWDVRLEKFVDVCLEGGHSVCMVSKGRSGLFPTEVKGEVYNVRVFPKGLQGIAARIASCPAFFNPLWRSTALRTFRQNPVDVIIVRDLPLAMLAVWVGRKLKKPVIIDMAENYPAALLAYENRLYKPFLVRNAWLPRKYEELSAKRLDHVLVVAEEQRQRLLALGLEAQKITLVGNTPIDSFLVSGAVPEKGSPEGSQNVNLLYAGKLDVHRGADLLIRALPALLREFPGLRMTLVGDGKDKARLESLAKQLALNGAVRFPGWVEWDKIGAFIRESTVCLIPHLRSEHTDTTLPNKLFDYMAFSKPVVTSDCAPLKRIVEQEDCGLAFQSGNCESLVAALRTLLRDPAREERGRNGRRAVEKRYNWGLDKRRLLETIERVGGSRHL